MNTEESKDDNAPNDEAVPSLTAAPEDTERAGGMHAYPALAAHHDDDEETEIEGDDEDMGDVRADDDDDDDEAEDNAGRNAHRGGRGGSLHDDNVLAEASAMLQLQASKDIQEEEEEDNEEGNDHHPDEEAAAAARALGAYSTRGRTAETGGLAGEATSSAPAAAAAAAAAMSSHHDPLERLARDALGGLADLVSHVKDASSQVAPRPSFLSEMLTEEERRTRTRYLPEVDGIHQLRKTEVKSDLSLARQAAAAAASASSTTVSTSRSNKRDDDTSPAGSDEDRASELARLAGTKTVEIADDLLIVPSPAFVAPPATDTKKNSTKADPTHVEAMSVFNPPRPPESLGAKKKHRIMRWEKQPDDIEHDLHNYRKTVQKTREELKKAVAEKERIRITDNHLRRHYLKHLKCLNAEWEQLSHELQAVQQECVNTADLLTSRTRSRGSGKGSYVMKDVLAVLRTRGAEIKARGLTLDSIDPTAIVTPPPVPGAGGVSAVSLGDWTGATVITPGPTAAAWVVAGDAVTTPYGDGTVLHVLPRAPLDPQSPTHATVQQYLSSKTKNVGANDVVMADASEALPESVVASGSIVGPRIAVQLPFGVAFLSPTQVLSKEKIAAYSDEQLVKRWKGLIETAEMFGSVVDVEALATWAATEDDEGAADGVMDVEESAAMGTPKMPDLVKTSDQRALPVGAGMMSSAAGRGAVYDEASIEQLEKAIHAPLFDGMGVVGAKSNPAVPTVMCKLEDDREEHLVLQARVMQLRHELYRQRRIRMLNERTLTSSQERATRAESLVSEMRSDLKSLQSRLDEEVRELGLTEERADEILMAYFRSLDNKDAGDASPPKRQRRQSRMDLDEENDQDAFDNIEEHLPERV